MAPHSMPMNRTKNANKLNKGDKIYVGLYSYNIICVIVKVSDIADYIVIILYV